MILNLKYIPIKVQPELPQVTGNPRNLMVFDAPYLQNEFGETQFFFYVFNLILSFSTCIQSFKEICMWEILGVNVLKHNIKVSWWVDFYEKCKKSFFRFSN